MKSLFYSALLLAFFGSVATAQADNTIWRRDKCRWYQDKFRSQSIGKVCWAIDRVEADHSDCAWAESWVVFFPCNLSAYRKGEGIPFNNGPYTGNPFWAVIGEAVGRVDQGSLYTNEWGGYGSYGYTEEKKDFGGFGTGVFETKCQDSGEICMGRDGAQMQFPSAAPALLPLLPTTAFRSVHVNAATQTFNATTRTVTVQNLQATLRNNPYDKINDYSAFYFSVVYATTPEEDKLVRNDEDTYRSHVLDQSRVLLNNGRLTIDGILQQATISTRDSAGVQIASITMPEIRLQVPSGINFEDVVLSAGSDVGNLESGISNRYLPGANSRVLEVGGAITRGEVLEFSNYPNPVVRGPVTVDVLIAAPEKVVIELYDQVGRLVLPVYSGLLPGGTRRSFPVNLRELAPGNYFLRLKRGESQLTRRVVVE